MRRLRQGADNATIARLVVDRSGNLFGFNAPSNYMAYVDWNLSRSASDLSANGIILRDNHYAIAGSMIAGIETQGDKLRDLQTENITTFEGKGRGSYGNGSESYATIFDVKAEVNFEQRSVALDVENNIGRKCDNVGNCESAPLTLDFSTTLKYTAQTNNLSSTNIGVGGLSGRADARFYGPTAEEFGGTFVLAGATIDNYYYGAFGAGRGAIIVPAAFEARIRNDILGYQIEQVINTQILASDYASITAAAVPSTDGTVLTLNALATYQHDVFSYARSATSVPWKQAVITPKVYIANVLNPAASLTFDAAGKLSATTLYLANQTYQASGADDSDRDASRFSKTTITDGETTVIAVDRSSDFFGFTDEVGGALTSNYMAFISWDLSKTANRIDDAANTSLIEDSFHIAGGMLAGIESNASDIPTSVNGIAFTGRGQGFYGSFGTNEAGYVSQYDTALTAFNVTATVDFASSNLVIAVDDTACHSSGCSLEAGILEALDFSSPSISYNGTGNNISGSVAAGDLSGRLDARFYGGAAREFGGTFAMLNIQDSEPIPDPQDEDKIIGWRSKTTSYHGVFGSERSVGIATPLIFDANIKDDIATNADTISTDYASLYAAVEAAKTEAVNGFIIQGLSVYQDDRLTYTRAPNRAWNSADTLQTISLSRISGGTASLNFNAEGQISANANIGEAIAAGADRNGISSHLDGANYMAYISWTQDKNANIAGNNASDDLSEYSDNSRGMMLAGIETQNVFIPLSNGDDASEIDFTGKGRGFYTDTKAGGVSYATFFDVTARVDFATNKLTINSGGTCDASDCANISRAALDFSTGSIAYRGNDVSDIVRAGDLTGRLDARFYGDVAWEFGGTFATADAGNESYYYGVFGSERGGITTVTFDATLRNKSVNAQQLTAINSAFSNNSGGYTSLKNVADGGDGNAFTMRGLSVYKTQNTVSQRAPNRTKSDRVDNVSFTKVGGGAASLTFNDAGLSAVQIYLNNGNGYRATIADPASGTPLTITEGAAADADSATVTFDRSAEFFDFDSDYMAALRWNITKNTDGDALKASDYNHDGAMLVGMETLATNIPITGNASFEGKGRGMYGTEAGDNYATIFNANAFIDFGNKTAIISGSNTCKASDCTEKTDELNFGTAALKYNSNHIGGDVVSTYMTGALEARFYGTGGDAGKEFGGTFYLANYNSYYYGAFGTLREEETGNNTPPPPVIVVNPFVPHHNLAFSAVATTEASNQQVTDSGTYVSLAAIADGNVTLQGLAVSFADITDYERANANANWDDTAKLKIDRVITASRITSSAVALSFTNGAISDATIYADADYSNVTVDRSIIFGFDSNYMAHISWGSDEAFDATNEALTQNITDIGGAMVAGIETADANIFTAGTVAFYGKGSGRYGNATARYDSIFDVIADIDFDAKHLTISATNSCDASDCAGKKLSNLDFSTGAILYTGNIISADVTIGTLAGRLDARFYGDDAQEFGGAFATADATSYYYGAFGAERGEVILPPPPPPPFVPTVINYGGYGSFEMASDGATTDVQDKTLSFSGTAVGETGSTTLTRADTATPFFDEQ